MKFDQRTWREIWSRLWRSWLEGECLLLEEGSNSIWTCWTCWMVTPDTTLCRIFHNFMSQQPPSLYKWWVSRQVSISPCRRWDMETLMWYHCLVWNLIVFLLLTTTWSFQLRSQKIVIQPYFHYCLCSSLCILFICMGLIVNTLTACTSRNPISLCSYPPQFMWVRRVGEIFSYHYKLVSIVPF